jgi:hypothetical protein
MRDIAQAAADAARVPGFDELLDRGRRHRNRRTALTATGAALAVATIIGATQLVGGDDGREPDLAPLPSETTFIEPSPESAAAAIVDDPEAQIADAAVAPNGATAVLWRVVGQQPHALAVSGDGFETRRESRLPIPGTVVPAGDGFIVRDEALSKVWLVPADGERRLVEVDGATAPAAEGEVVVANSDGLVAVDPAKARAHPVPSPEGTYAISSYGGRLSGFTNLVHENGARESTYHWSDDGGATWRSTTFDSGELGIPEVVRSVRSSRCSRCRRRAAPSGRAGTTASWPLSPVRGWSTASCGCSPTCGATAADLRASQVCTAGPTAGWSGSRRSRPW